MPLTARYFRLAPLRRLAGTLRQQLRADNLSVLLLKAAVRHVSRRKTRARHDPEAWRGAWQQGESADWPKIPVVGIVEHAGIKVNIDRCEMTTAGHLWLDGWAVGADAASFRLAATQCGIAWQASFATPRPDVVQTLRLSLVGRPAHVGLQLLARITDHVPGRSRLALTAGNGDGAPALVVPVVAEMARGGSMWHSLYQAMRLRGSRDVAYLDTSVALLGDLRKLDWRERSADIRRCLDEAMPHSTALKVLILSRLHPVVAYLNLNLLAAACVQPADFVVCSMGQAAIQRANEYRGQFASIGAHAARYVAAEIATPSSEMIEQFALSCQQRGCPGLIVYDDVAVAGAMASLGEALRRPGGAATAWSRQYPHTGPAHLAHAEPLAAGDGPGPYWRSAKAMEHGALGALHFDPAGIQLPSMPPFEGRGYALEYLFTSVWPGADLAGETILDLVDPASQREAQGLDLLMLLASSGRPA